MITSKANAQWQGALKDGEGQIQMGDYQTKYSFDTRFAGESGTSPEQLLAAAHAGCFSMAFANMLDEDGYTPDQVATTANVELDADELSIPKITLVTKAKVAGIDEEKFQQVATKAKENCPVSKLFSSAEIELQATLENS